MECPPQPGGGGSTSAGMPPGSGPGAGQGGPHHPQQQQWGGTQFYGAEMQPQQQQQNQLLLQQQQLMQLAAAAAASGQAGGHQAMIPASVSQAPTLNMMLQGINQAIAGPHHTLPSPSNSAGHGFLLLQQPQPGPGMPHQGRDISPGSTPGLGQGLPQPPPSATPPSMIDDRSWQHQGLFFGGHRQMIDKGLEEQMKNQDLFMDSGYRQHPQHQQTPEQHHQMINQMQHEMAMARGFNQYQQYAPAQSPPTMFQQQPMPHPMPPRPRPEGGQDPSPNFLKEELSQNAAAFKSKKEDLVVIDSWTGGPPSMQQQQQQQQQQQTNASEESENFYMRAGL